MTGVGCKGAAVALESPSAASGYRLAASPNGYQETPQSHLEA
jgi:hypothetical protein